MKRISFISVILFVIVNNIIANSDFNVNYNYQGNNVKAYIGEILIVRETGEFLFGFKDYYSFDENEYSHPYNAYMYGADNTYRTSGSNTYKDYVVGKSFKVIDAKPHKIYHDSWVLSLVNVNNANDRCKYIYELPGELNEYTTNVTKFPFFVKKYIDNAKKNLIGKKVIVSTRTGKYFTKGDAFYYSAPIKDINTDETINYEKSYAEYTVKNIEVDKEYPYQLALILSNSKHTTRVLYNFHYIEDVNNGIKPSLIYTESQWNKMCNKYGESHMEAVMNNNIISGMTYEEASLVGGFPCKKRNTDNNTIVCGWEAVDHIDYITFKDGIVVEANNTTLGGIFKESINVMVMSVKSLFSFFF